MRHGTYDHAGAFHPQLVHLGTTMSGVPGLFTGNTLAWPITRDLFEAFRTDHVGLKAYVERIGFTLAPDSVLDQQDVRIMHEATERGWFEQQVCREAP